MSVAVWREGEDIILRLYIQPKASRDKIVGLHGEEIKIAITAPPVDGKANAHLSKYLAKQFKVAKGLVNIEKGELGRHKQVRIISPNQVPTEIEAIL
ncbi:MAG TPA: YggU family protein [Vibrio sp.]|nr:YggU family protein [Vibrio sp.]